MRQQNISDAETCTLAECRSVQCSRRFRLIVLIRALDSGLVPRDPSTAACIRPKHTTKQLSLTSHQGNHAKTGRFLSTSSKQLTVTTVAAPS